MSPLDLDYEFSKQYAHIAISGQSNEPERVMEELKKEKLILRLPSSNTANLFDQALNQNNLSITDFDVVLEMENIATIKDLIRQNLGVSVLSRSACADEIKKGKLIGIPIENMSLIRDTNIVYPKDYENLKNIQDIVELYKAL